MKRDEFILMRTRLRLARDSIADTPEATVPVNFNHEELVTLLRYIPDAAQSLDQDDL
jgi:hypothetical protein